MAARRTTTALAATLALAGLGAAGTPAAPVELRQHAGLFTPGPAPLTGLGLAASVATNGDPAEEVLAFELTQQGPEIVRYAVPGSVSAEDLVDLLLERPDVEAAEPGGTWAAADGGQLVLQSGDPQSARQWQLAATRATSVRDRSGGRAVVAVLDTGVDARHEDLAGLVLPGWDFVSGRSTATDRGDHGTMVAGLITAATDNGIGIAATVRDLRILPGTVCTKESCDWGHVAAGILWAADPGRGGADVINLSLAGPDNSSVVEQAVAYAGAQGVVVVAAAGNEGNGRNARTYPAALPGVIGVGATSRNDKASGFSGRGDWVDVVAPGDDVWTTTPGSAYAGASGTSFAVPQVSAAAALAHSLQPSLSPAQIADALAATARDVDRPGPDPKTGAGVIDLAALVSRLGSRATPPSTSQPPSNGNPPAPPPPAAPAPPSPPSSPSTPPSSPGPPSAPAPPLPPGANPVLETPPSAHPSPPVGIAAVPQGSGYLVAHADGRVVATGGARHHGDLAGRRLNVPIVGVVTSASGNGYWLVAGDGGVFSFGDAGFFGSTGAMRLNAPVTSLSPTPSGRGYWMVATDGGIFAFGDASFHGSMGAVRLNRPINGITRSPSGRGYRMVATDGGVFSFGDAPFFGSTGASPPSSPIVGMAPAPGNAGYWLLLADGRVAGFGSAGHLGDAPGRAAVSLAAHPSAPGYRILFADGSTKGYGVAP